jgi:serine/threonine protein kinase
MQLQVELLDDDLQPNGWVVHLGVTAPLGKGTFGSTWRAASQQVSASSSAAAGGSASVTPRTSARRRSLLPTQRPQVPSMVALKVAHRFDQCEYPPGYTSDLHAADMQTSYIQEYGILAAVDSQHVVSTYGLGRLVYEDGESVLVLLLELVEGGALDTWLEQRGLANGLQPPAAKALLQQVAQGLADLHEPSRQQHVGEQRWFDAVAHRDLKPANLLVVPEAAQGGASSGRSAAVGAGGGGVRSSAAAAGGGGGASSIGAAVSTGHTGIQLLKLADFGSAKILAHPEDSGDDMDGTPLYMAPEVAARQPHGTKADVYSLGVLYVYLRFGGRPFGYLWRQLRQRVWQWQGQWVGGLTGKRLEEADIALHIALRELASADCPYNKDQPGGEEGVTAPALSDAERAWLQWVMAPDPQQRPSMMEVLQDSRGFFTG